MQVERLNKKIRRILRYRLLDFSPEEQSTVWSFLLPEIAFILNNSWYSALCATPFEVFFGKASRQCSSADRGNVAVWPSDEFLAFMRDSHSKHEKVFSHAVKMRESIHDFVRQLVKINSAEYLFLDELGLTEKANDLNVQVDLFCYACDCSFLATVAEDTELSAQLNRLFVSIMNFLKEADFRFYFAGLCI